MFGTAGLPHILMRFFTVPDAKEARKSVFWASTWIGYFDLLIFIIGFGAITLVLTNPEFADTAKGVILSILDRSPQAAKERAAFADQQVRSETGYGASGASGH